MQKEYFFNNLLVRVHFIIVMIRWTSLAPWELEFPFPGSLTSTFLAEHGLLFILSSSTEIDWTLTKFDQGRKPVYYFVSIQIT